ncbi:transcription antiterminator [Bacillus atrophaeus]|uniref:antiterminator LoaP n=1 Tax=Bacillus atrophaeus TaxID=1452 RepID=UPI000D06D832|nr:antiterminator LoaP [Bacillus atrophaeus]MCY8910319.1 antiterminator LoaP [Bacillus atrophaeus]MEC0835926.1 antiterminator LoaP [Bacillus atrophaeus]MEC0847024.1 antiterminator LoaP [Bacillus atrophaeus]MEC0848339.1 antiterminator LoaP [Bacillus atrophaeus]MEC0864798.1 antiterminator LoaP [Bacillus atrophaeus]
MEWYALFVETGKEEVVQQNLKLIFDKTLLDIVIPKRKIPEKKDGKVNHVIRIIFPGYVLVKTKMTARIYHKIKKIPNVCILVNRGVYYSKDYNENFTKIDEGEIKPLLKLLSKDDIIDYSKVYIEKSKVLVKCGPLKGNEAIIKRVDKRKNRAKILLNFLGKENTIDVGIEVLSKSNTSKII